jgi:hypothetical protein
MTTLLPLREMSRDKKLRALEELWADLSADGEFETPAWHKEELRRTEQLVREGKAKFVDWEGARRDLRRKTSARA